MAEGGSLRRRAVVADDGGDTPGLGDFTDPCERVPALRLRPVGEPMAEAARTRIGDHRPLRRRFRRGIPSTEATPNAFSANCGNALSKFGLQLHPEKTRLIEFGRYAAERRAERGEGKPETFDFLGFTHCCGKTRKGAFTIKRKSIAKRMRAKLQEIKQQLTAYACTTRWSRWAAGCDPWSEGGSTTTRSPETSTVSTQFRTQVAASLASHSSEAQPERT